MRVTVWSAQVHSAFVGVELRARTECAALSSPFGYAVFKDLFGVRVENEFEVGCEQWRRGIAHDESR
jgi:hypothetical protein